MNLSKIITYIAIFIALILGYARYIEWRCVFFPTKGLEFTPQDIGVRFEDAYIQTEDGLKVNGWFIPRDNAKYTLLFLHGNAGNIGHRLEKIRMLRDVGLDIFIIDYRGYGRSQGRPSEKGIYLDAAAAYAYLVNTRKVLPQQIILYGESLGTTAVINLAAASEVKAIILEGAFSSGQDIAKVVFPFMPGFLFRGKYDSLAKIAKVRAAKLFLHSRQDEIVPFGLAQKLYTAAPAPKHFVEIQGNHNNSFLDTEKEYISAIASFVDKL